MKFDSTRDQLATLLRLTAPAVGKAADQPVLANVSLTLAGNTLTARTTDLALAVTAAGEVTGADDGTVLVSHAAMTKIVAKLEPGTVSVTTDTSEVVLSGGAARIALPTVADTGAFPRLVAPDVDARQVDASTLAAALAQVVPSAGVDLARPPLTGVYVEGGEHLRLVATDGYRLAVRDLVSSLVDEGVSALIPASALAAVPKVLGTSGPVAVRLGERSVTFTTDVATVWMRLIEAQFPAYKSIIPESSSSTFSVDRDALAAALERAMLVNKDVVTFSFEDQAVTLTCAGAGGSGSGLEAVAGTLVGPAIELRANPRYVLDGLTATDGQSVTMGFTEPMKPIRLTGDADGFLYVFMPLR